MLTFSGKRNLAGIVLNHTVWYNNLAQKITCLFILTFVWVSICSEKDPLENRHCCYVNHHPLEINRPQKPLFFLEKSPVETGTPRKSTCFPGEFPAFLRRFLCACRASCCARSCTGDVATAAGGGAASAWADGQWVMVRNGSEWLTNYHWPAKPMFLRVSGADCSN